MPDFIKTNLYTNPEFQSALVRLGVWVFAVVYVATGLLSERYDVNVTDFIVLFAVYLLFFFSLLVSVLIRPVWEARRYFSLAVDISATSICLYLTGEVVSPFYVLYIWIFISYGTRYGRQHLMAASALSIFAYSVVLTVLGQWQEYLFEASFVLLALVALPIYQYSLVSQLLSARLEAERSNRQMGRFLSNMTNDMRSPLADIMTTSNELSDSKLSMKQLDKVEEISASATLLDAVIGDVLDFSKMEARQLRIEPAPFNLSTLMLDTCLSTNRRALQNKIELACLISKDVPRVIVGDEARLRQVLTNIIKNAIDNFFCAEIKVSVRIDDLDHDLLLFEVKGEAPFLSGKTVYVDEDFKISTSPELGVDLARRQMLLMGGELESGPEECDSVFRLRLPILANDFEVDPIFRLSCLYGKKAFVFEPSKSSRETIINCCEEAGMIVSSVDEISALGNAVSESRERHDIDIILVADSPGGRNIERITDICLDVLGQDLPLVILACRHNCLELDRYKSAVLIRKPFIADHLLDAMEMVLVSDAMHGDGHSSVKPVAEEGCL